MFKIKFFSTFCSSETCKVNFEKVFNSKDNELYGENNKIYITTGDDYTHAIILNLAMPELNVPKENVLGLAFEPRELLNLNQEFIKYAEKTIGKYLIGNNSNLPNCFIESFTYMWYNNPNRSIPIEEKQAVISFVISEKKFAPGHKYRFMLADKILELNLPIDIYGRGCHLFDKKYTNVKGRFNNAEPYEKYLFCICIENYQSNDYFSEKLLDPLLHNCNPIYLGAKNIKNYFNNIIQLKGNILFDIEMLQTILKNPLKYYTQTYNERNLSKINFFDNIPNFFTPLKNE